MLCDGSVVENSSLIMMGFITQAASSVLVDEDDPSKGTVKIRVGLASGPVTATVIGSRNPK